MMIKRAVLGTVLAWFVVALGGLIVLGLSGCSSGPIGPTSEAEAKAVALAWNGMLAMSSYPAPITTWYRAGDDGCGIPLPGTTFANGVCVGGAISIAGDHRESEINIQWPGSLSASAWCASVVGIKNTIVGGALLLWPDAADPRVADCRDQLQAAGL